MVSVYGADERDGRVGFWMELVTGRTLQQLLHDYGPLSAREALLVGVDLCHALAAVHQAGFLHCDLKAQNVMREAGGRIVLMDFGASVLRRLEGDEARRTRGTPLYLAPEVLRGEPATVQSDFYSLGVLLFYLVSGEFPFEGRSLSGLQAAHVQDQRKLLRDVRPDLPGPFVSVVDAATAGAPEDRPESAGAFEKLLEHAAGHAAPRYVAPAHGHATRERSIAVLPFVDMTPTGSLQYFCDGISEEIIEALTRVSGLRVMGRHSTFAFRNSPRSAQEIGATLGVGSVLEGSVRASGEVLRAIARLVDAADGRQIWSERFDRRLDDVLAVQDDIAQAVARSLGFQADRSSAAAAAPLGRAGTRDVEAYTLCLKGRYCWNQRTEATLHKAAAYFAEAVRRDPAYAEALAGLGAVQTTLSLYGVSAPREAMSEARHSATRALAINPGSSIAHVVLGCVAAVYDWSWQEAEVRFRKAIQLDPDDSAAHHWYAINFLVPLARFDEAAEELRRAVHSDPLSMPVRMSAGLMSYFAHRFADAEHDLRECLDIDPGAATARLFLGLSLVEMGQAEAALRQLETALELSPSPEMTAALGYAYARNGQVDRARRELTRLLKLSDTRFVSPSLFAQVYSGLGEAGNALDWLEKALHVRASDLAWLGVRPVFDAVRTETRFATLLSMVRDSGAAAKP